jgi:tetratricopeptide (TPR) repeat protein
MNRQLLMLAAVTIALASPLVAETTHRKALVIGNDSYNRANALLNATNDARDVAAALKALGYSINLSLNVTRAQLGEAISLFCQGLVPGDAAVLYYSGHGFQMDGDNYLVPIDFKATTATEGQGQGYSVSAILKQLAGSGADIQVIILDACRDNPFFTSKSAQAGWADMGVPAGTLIAYGTSPGSTASDNPGGSNGLFTKALLSHISSVLAIEEMLKQVRKDTIIASLGAQTPWTAASLIGEFYLNPETQTSATKSTSLSLDEQLSVLSVTPTQRTASNNRSGPETGSFQSPADLKSADILVNQGLLLVRQGNYGEATRSLSAALALHPGFSIALRVLGLILSALGRGADAVAEFSRAISANPSDYLAYYYRCSALTKPDPSEAVRDCEAAIGLEPTFVPAHLGLANALFASGNADNALSEINETIALAPGSAQAHALRAKVFEVLGQHENAAKDVNAAVGLSLAARP